jgi:hypothetical protein
MMLFVSLACLGLSACCYSLGTLIDLAHGRVK